jgi:hypothetical protein
LARFFFASAAVIFFDDLFFAAAIGATKAVIATQVLRSGAPRRRAFNFTDDET